MGSIGPPVGEMLREDMIREESVKRGGHWIDLTSLPSIVSPTTVNCTRRPASGCCCCALNCSIVESERKKMYDLKEDVDLFATLAAADDESLRIMQVATGRLN